MPTNNSKLKVVDKKSTENKSKTSQLPTPCGYKILIGLPEITDKTAGGIIKPDAIIETESIASVVGFVLELGPDCYNDKSRFPNGSFCKKGDFVLVRAFQGTRFQVHGKEFRLINDDNVEAVVDDPRGYTRL